MVGITLFGSIVIIVFGILQIILFFKIWGMTNNVSEMKNMMELFLRKDFHHEDNLNEAVSSNIRDNSEFDKEDFPSNAKFNKGDVVLYKAENIKLIITGYMPPNVFKCATIDNIEKIYYFQEDYLEKFTE